MSRRRWKLHGSNPVALGNAQELRDPLGIAQENLEMYEEDLGSIAQCAENELRRYVNFRKEEPSSDYGAESLHRWHIAHKVRGASFLKHEETEDFAKHNLRLLEKDVENAK